MSGAKRDNTNMLQIRLTGTAGKRMKRWLERIAKAQGITMSDVIRQMIYMRMMAEAVTTKTAK